MGSQFGIEDFFFPPHSPDLNFIKHLELERRLWAKSYQLTSVALHRKSEREQIQPNFPQNYIHSGSI